LHQVPESFRKTLSGSYQTSELLNHSLTEWKS